MLKMISKKSLLLFGVVLALCAFVLPSVASAASWSPVGTTDGRIDSSNLGFSSAALNSGSFCRQVSFSVSVDSASVATINGASFVNCHGDIGGAAGCTVTATGTNFPWVATAPATSNVQIHGVDIDVRFETTPPAGSVPCASNGLQIRLTGTVTPAVYTAVPRVLHFELDHGLTAHVPGVGSALVVARGSVSATGLLNILD